MDSHLLESDNLKLEYQKETGITLDINSYTDIIQGTFKPDLLLDPQIMEKVL